MITWEAAPPASFVLSCSPQNRARVISFFVLFRAPARVGRIRPAGRSRAPSSGKSPRLGSHRLHFPPRCLSSGVRPLCCIACSQSYVASNVELDRRPFNTREAQRSSELVVSRHDAGPFVLNTNLRPQRTADHPRRERHCGQGLVRCVDEPRSAPFRQGGINWTRRSVPTRLARDQAQRVNVRIGCSMQHEFKCTMNGRDVQSTLAQPRRIVQGCSSGRFLEQRARVDPRL